LTLIGNSSNSEDCHGCQNTQNHDDDEQLDKGESLISTGLHCFLVDIHAFSFQLKTVNDACDIGKVTLG
jgi:hypothetical protein